jgi:hypothetical protein
MKKFTDIYQSSILVIGALSLMVMCWYQRREINTLIDENTKVKLEAETLQGGDILKAQSYDSVLALKDSFYYENFIFLLIQAKGFQRSPYDLLKIIKKSNS